MIEIPKKVEAVLNGAAKRVRRIYMLRGTAVSLAVFLFITLLFMVLDACVTIFSDPLRWTLSATVYLLTLLSVCLTVMRPLLRRIDMLKIAKILDERHEKNEECLTTLVELIQDKKRNATSLTFIRLIAKKAELSVASIDIVKEFTFRTFLRRIYALLIVLGLLIVSFISLPRLAGVLFIRIVAPWVEVGNIYSDVIKVRPGDVNALVGEEIEINAKADEDFRYIPEIRISHRRGNGWSEEMSSSMSGGVYRVIANLSENDWRYRVSAGPAVTRYYSVRVFEMPSYKSFSARIEYPEYSGLKTLVISNDAVSAIRALEGSKVYFKTELDHRANKAFLSIAGMQRDEWTMVSNRVVTWSLTLENAVGFRAHPTGGVLESVIDNPPSIVLEKPQKSIRVPPHAKIPIEVTASDDTPYLSNEIVVKIGNGDWQDLRPLSTFSRTGASLWRGADDLDLSLLDLKNVSSLQFAVCVRDSYPIEKGGPHSVTSTPVTVHLENRAESYQMQSLVDEKANMNNLINEARRRMEAADRLANQAKNNINREKKASEHTDKQIALSEHEMNEAEKRLDEMREKAVEDPRFKPLKEQLDSLIDETMQSIKDKLETAQFAASEDRVKALEEVPKEMKEAMEKLKELKNAMEQRVEELRNYEKISDLAKRQEVLAKMAEEISKAAEEKKPDPKLLDAWTRLQKETAAQAKKVAMESNDAEVDEARREMENAANAMNKEKAEAQMAERLSNNPEALKKHKEELARQEEAMKQQAYKNALQRSKEAEEALKRAAKENNLNSVQQLLRQAVNLQSTAQDVLENANVEGSEREDLHEAEKQTREAIEEAIEAKKASEKRGEGAKAAAEEAFKEMDQARKEALAAQQEAQKELEKALSNAQQATAEKATAEKNDGGKLDDGEKAVAEKAGEKTGSEEAASSEKASGENGAGEKTNDEKKKMSSSAKKAAEAAESLKEHLKEEAKELGLKEDDQQESSGGAGISDDSEKNSVSGGVAGELKNAMRELKAIEKDENFKLKIRDAGWFKVKGSAKNGLGEKDLKDIPLEYRNLIRLYFQKLSEESK